jgi:pimeloyl-ACP methyl ester carboxylesterase
MNTDSVPQVPGHRTTRINHRIVDSNGIKMHIAENGKGPLVVLCHGYPELWYSWRHQLRALAEAGYHAVAPDQRGYGQTDRPEAVEDYNILQSAGPTNRAALGPHAEKWIRASRRPELGQHPPSYHTIDLAVRLTWRLHAQ